MCVCHNDDKVANLKFACGSTVKAYFPAASLSFYDICVNSFAIVYVYNGNLFVFVKPCCLYKIFINGNAANVVEIGFSYAYTVNF